MTSMNALLTFLADRRTRLVLAWLLLGGAVGQRAYAAKVNFEVPDRPIKNDGHTSIDFGGQWMMGRLLVLGHGRELYSRETHRRVANESYPRDQEPAHRPSATVTGSSAWYAGSADDPVGGPLVLRPSTPSSWPRCSFPTRTPRIGLRRSCSSASWGWLAGASAT